MLGDVGDAAFERDLALQWILGDDVCFRADNVDDGFFFIGLGWYGRAVCVVLAELLEPNAHLVEGGCVCYVVAEECGVCTAVCMMLEVEVLA